MGSCWHVPSKAHGLLPIQLGLRRAQSKVSCAGIPEWVALVENVQPHACPVLATACLLIQTQPCYQQAFIAGDMGFWEHKLLSKGMHIQQPISYQQLHAQHSKIMGGIGLADDKAGTALHIFRSTGNAKLSRHGATKSQIDAWGRWDQSTQHVSYAAKDSLHALPMLALLAGWGQATGRSSSWAAAWPGWRPPCLTSLWRCCAPRWRP